MAEQITEFTEARRAGSPRKYQWDQWTNGAKWCIRRGEDYEIKPSSMAGLIRKHALRVGLLVRVHVYDDTGRIEFQFRERDDELEAAA